MQWKKFCVDDVMVTTSMYVSLKIRPESKKEVAWKVMAVRNKKTNSSALRLALILKLMSDENVFLERPLITSNFNYCDSNF